MQAAQLKTALVTHYQWLRQYGLNDSHSGNASIRLGEDIWITPTGACADTLTVSDLVHVSLHGDITPGASLDAPLHRLTYQKQPEASAILHSHGPHSIALTLNGNNYQPIDFEGQYYFNEIPVLDIPFAEYVEQSPQRVAQALSRSPIAIVRGHGVYAWGKDLSQVYKWTCSLESSMRIDHLYRLDQLTNKTR